MISDIKILILLSRFYILKSYWNRFHRSYFSYDLFKLIFKTISLLSWFFFFGWCSNNWFFNWLSNNWGFFNVDSFNNSSSFLEEHFERSFSVSQEFWVASFKRLIFLSWYFLDSTSVCFSWLIMCRMVLTLCHLKFISWIFAIYLIIKN